MGGVKEYFKCFVLDRHRLQHRYGELEGYKGLEGSVWPACDVILSKPTIFLKLDSGTIISTTTSIKRFLKINNTNTKK